jgi:hypothetical protein
LDEATRKSHAADMKIELAGLLKAHREAAEMRVGEILDRKHTEPALAVFMRHAGECFMDGLIELRKTDPHLTPAQGVARAAEENCLLALRAGIILGQQGVKLDDFTKCMCKEHE